MELSEAVKLIRKGVEPVKTSQTWADLGAGNGLFTYALAELLPANSIVYPVDTLEVVNKISVRADRYVRIHPVQADMTTAVLHVALDGLLMANSLHFVQDQEMHIKRWINSLKPAGKVIIVEYDLRQASPWVPFPISFNRLEQMAGDLGIKNPPIKLSEKPSLYNHSVIYTALLQM